jgi:hypothetical protein
LSDGDEDKMGKHLNFYSFFLSFAGLILFYLTRFTGIFKYIRMGIHPLILVFILTMVGFILGVFGFLSIRDWKSYLLGLLSLIISFSLLVLILSILFMGKLLS